MHILADQAPLVDFQCWRNVFESFCSIVYLQPIITTTDSNTCGPFHLKKTYYFKSITLYNFPFHRTKWDFAILAAQLMIVLYCIMVILNPLKSVMILLIWTVSYKHSYSITAIYLKYCKAYQINIVLVILHKTLHN